MSRRLKNRSAAGSRGGSKPSSKSKSLGATLSRRVRLNGGKDFPDFSKGNAARKSEDRGTAALAAEFKDQSFLPTKTTGSGATEIDDLSRFDEESYLSAHADVRRAVELGHIESGYAHYVLYGRVEGRAATGKLPSSSENSAVASKGEQGSEPAGQQDAGQGRVFDSGNEIQEIDRSGLFDRSWYLRENSDVATAGGDPLEHFYYVGWRERRRPNAYFDFDWYGPQVETGLLEGVNPLLHYFRTGERQGVRPVIYFDPTWYRARYNLGNDESALGHYLQHVESGTVAPIPYFDVGYYLETYPDVRAAGIDPFRHFLENGYREGRNPSATFDVGYYSRRYLRGSLTENPLLHYLAHRHDPTIRTCRQEDEKSWATELKRFTARGPAFEELRPSKLGALPRAKVLAFYLPQFHAFPENDLWWGNGFTEWTNIVRGAPRFEGHYQPRVPRDLGFYDLLSPGVMERQIRLARAAGLYGFVYYFYSFGTHRLMEAPLENLLKDASLDFPFCLMWANENWTRRWDGLEADVLIAQEYSDSDDDQLVDCWLRYFRDPRYIRIDGRPLLMIYRPGIIPNARRKIALWRSKIINSGEQNPVITMAQGFGDLDPTIYGLDGAVEFPPHKVAAGLDHINRDLAVLDETFTGQVFSYDSVVDRAMAESPPNFPLIRTAFPSWDNDARRQGGGMVIHGSTPESYQSWLERLINYSIHHPFLGERLVCINAWNEWAEGAYLEPDLHFGSAYLNATARAVHGETIGGLKNICLVGHDAHAHGAQMLLLNLARIFVRQFGLNVELVMLGGGPLLSSYREVATTTVASQAEELQSTFQRLFQRGFRYAIVNSAASARSIEIASAAGHQVTLLVHELPALIQEKALLPALERALPCARRVIFAAEFVREQFMRLVNVERERTTILPQGSYTPVTFSPALREHVRASLQIEPNATVVLGVGFGDLRKGFDIFINAWRASERRGRKAHFIWVGNIEDGIRTYMRSELETARASGRLHTVPFTKEVGAYYSAADVFLLTSREDPFPTVVLEAMQAGIPCIAFEGSGGIPEMLQTNKAGRVVPMADAEAAVDVLDELLEEWPAEGRGVTNRLSCLGHSKFSFSKYAMDLVGACAHGCLKISVVVPNYNYARYLRSRLGSIFAQTYPVFELIVLDDCSTDSSLDVLDQVREESGREFEVIRNISNSGSVFRQWRKAAELAKGDYIWIAEADDECAPEFLARLAREFLGNENISLAYTDSRAIDEGGRELSPSYRFYYEESSPGAFAHDRVFSGRDFIRDHLSERNLILNVSSCLWRRDVFLDALTAVDDELIAFRLAGDWLLYVQALHRSAGRVAFVAQPLNSHRRHSTSVTHSALSAKRHIDEIRRVQALVWQLYSRDASMKKRQMTYLRHVAKQLADKAVLGSEPALGL